MKNNILIHCISDSAEFPAVQKNWFQDTDTEDRFWSRSLYRHNGVTLTTRLLDVAHTNWCWHFTRNKDWQVWGAGRQRPRYFWTSGRAELWVQLHRATNSLHRHELNIDRIFSLLGKEAKKNVLSKMSLKAQNFHSATLNLKTKNTKKGKQTSKKGGHRWKTWP